MDVSFNTVVQYLRIRVGEGGLRLSDIYFAIPKQRRQVLQEALESLRPMSSWGRQAYLNQRFPGDDLSPEEIELFGSLRNQRVFAGDMYEYISETEVDLHETVRRTLVAEFGDPENGWWRQGIPSEIREKCVNRRELDEEPSDSPFAYTDLIDLSKIIVKNLALFQNVLPREYANRKALELDLRRLNSLRNSVMQRSRIASGRRTTLCSCPRASAAIQSNSTLLTLLD
jgi:hypothetical protein